ncbi:unnamed protein product [Moneuplotes crassus]|uniref:VPS9 domain-containing protein n=1 Tax=Euplotes crassus TaxID=5936 RepID=A0AAD1X6P2_EUPCR|nr:unnamed protein product [Moneuplotes crassus]
MGSSQSQDNEDLWKQREEYYETLSGNPTLQSKTSNFGRYSTGSMKKFENSDDDQGFYESYDSSKSHRNRNQNTQQSRSCLACCVSAKVESLYEKPFNRFLKDKSWLNTLIDGLMEFSKLQQGLKEIANYVKSNQEILNENKQNFYDEIELIRIKYEYGKKAAWRYQDTCEELDDNFVRTFIDNNFECKNDLDTSCILDFVEYKKPERMSQVSSSKADFNIADQYGEVSDKTKALIFCIKKQINNQSHPINLLNQEFAKVFCKCYQKLVDKKQASSVKLKSKLKELNQRMVILSGADTSFIKKNESDEATNGSIGPNLSPKHNNMLTSQVIGDVKQFISLMLKTTKMFYLPVLRGSEFSELREDFVEGITNLILSNEVYKIVFSFLRLEFRDLEECLRERYREFTQLTPSECKVDEYFCCDATSPILKIHKDICHSNNEAVVSELTSINMDNPNRMTLSQRIKKELPKSFIFQRQDMLKDVPDTFEGKQDSQSCFEIIETEYEHRRSKSFNNVRKSSTSTAEITHSLPKIWEIENRLRQKPYQNAISKLKEINICEGPMKKVRLLEKVNTIIKKDIEKFWEGIPVDPNHLTITHDTKIPLYIFLIIRSKIVNLAANIKFINEFTTSYVHGSHLGNNLALYESAMTIVADNEKNYINNVAEQKKVHKQATSRFGSFATSIFNEDLDPFFEFENQGSFVVEKS